MQYKFADIIKQKNNTQQKIKKRKKFIIFLVCFIISAIFWLIIQLSTENTITLNFPVTFTKITKKYTITNALQSDLKITIKSKSINLILTKIFHDKKNIEIDLSNFTNDNASEQNIIIQSKKLSEQIVSQFIKNIEIVKIQPDSLFFNVEKTYSRQIPIKLNSKLSFDKNYFLYDKIKIIPESVFVYGSKNDIENLQYIESQSVIEKNIDKTIEKTLDLNYNKNIYLIPANKVDIKIPVEKYTETTFSTPVANRIKLKNLFTYKTFPDKVTVTVLVAQKDFKNINADMIIIGFDNENQINNKSIKLKILKQPNNIKITKIVPEKVDFILIK